MSGQLVSRHATPSNAPVAMQAQTDALMVRAKQIASAPRDMLPKHYQQNPGACLMAVDWADRNDVSIFEALGEVAFVHGRPVVSAVLQKKLAARAGYRTQVMASTPRSATVRVLDPDGNEVGGDGNGRVTYTIDMAKALGIFKGPVWQADPAHMLVKRATTRALEYFGPSELAPIMADPDSDGAAAEPAVEADSQVVDDAELVDELGPAAEPPLHAPDEQELKAALKAKGLSQADGLRAVGDMDYADLSTLAKVAGNADAAIDLMDWIDQQ